MGATTPPGTESGAGAAERPGSVLVERAGDGPFQVRLVGGIDGVLAPRLDTVVAAVAAGQPADVRLDLAEVDFLGSHGMAFLVRVQQAAHAGGRRAGIVAVSRSAQLALRIAGLEEFLSA